MVGGAIFAYALTQGEQTIKEEVETFNEEPACSGGCDGNCDGECGAADCGCEKSKVESCGSELCPQASECALNSGACGNSDCGCGR